MKILLLSCCAPCSCAVIEKIAGDDNEWEVAFYNPNIVPVEEYKKRCTENKELCERFNVPFVEFEYDNDTWCSLIKGFENEPERGGRCSICFYMRIKRVMEYAKEHGFDTVSSVLGTSRYKDLNQVNKAAEKASIEVDVPYMEFETRKDGMQQRCNQLVKELNLYHQNYCGCKPR